MRRAEGLTLKILLHANNPNPDPDTFYYVRECVKDKDATENSRECASLKKARSANTHT
jgi:hypothetical protein